jgi:CRISPR-associated protein Csx17
MPFTVQGSPDGSASGASGEESRGEVWAPVWRREFTLAEIKQMFTEARASWRGRSARRAVDFYAATRTLGVARGIDEFTRYGLQRRNGLAFAAVPLARVDVREHAEVRLAAEVEDWAARFGGSDTSAAVGQAARGFQASHLDYARDGGALPLARLLAALTRLEQAVGRSGRARDAAPVRYAPPARQFLDVLRQAECPELRVAVGLASCATLSGPDQAAAPSRTLRQVLLPVDPPVLGDKSQPNGRWRDAPLIPGFGSRALPEVLAQVLIWRSRTAAAEHGGEKFRGVTTFRLGVPVPAADLHTFASGKLNEEMLDLFLRSCLTLNWRNVRHEWSPTRPDIPVAILGLLEPLAAGIAPGDGDGDEPELALSPDWAARLAAGQVRAVYGEAAARLRRAGWAAATAPPEGGAGDGVRIAAALMPRCLHSRSVLSLIAKQIKPLNSGELS